MVYYVLIDCTWRLNCHDLIDCSQFLGKMLICVIKMGNWLRSCRFCGCGPAFFIVGIIRWRGRILCRVTFMLWRRGRFRLGRRFKIRLGFQLCLLHVWNWFAYLFPMIWTPTLLFKVTWKIEAFQHVPNLHFLQNWIFLIFIDYRHHLVL